MSLKPMLVYVFRCPAGHLTERLVSHETTEIECPHVDPRDGLLWGPCDLIAKREQVGEHR